MSGSGKQVGGLWRAARGLLVDASPYPFAVLAFAGGVLMLLFDAMPSSAQRLKLLAAPIFVIEFSHFMASLIGLLLLLVASALWRRRIGAYWLTLALLLAGAAFSLSKGLEYESALALVLIAAALAPCRRAFDRDSRLLRERPDPVWTVAVVAAVAAAGSLGLFAYRNVGYSDELWWTFLRDADASRFLRAGVAVAVLTLFAAIPALFAPPGPGRPRRTPEETARAEAILGAGGGGGTDAWLAVLDDKTLMFSDDGAAMLAYARRGRRWIAMGEPAGDQSQRRALMWRFVESADRTGAGAVFYAVTDRLLPDLAAMGLAIRQVGETAIVETETFTLSGKGRQNLRTACNRAAEAGATFAVLPPGAASANLAELKTVSDAWLKRQGGAEKRFSLGRFDVDFLDRTPIAVLAVDGRIVAFANLLPDPAGGEVAVDLMRHADDAPHGTMDVLFVRLIEWARGEGIARVNLGMTPLAGLETRRLAPLFARIGALIYAQGAGGYGFEGLRAYKAKFGPAWRPVYIAARPGVPMVLALLDVALLTSGGWRGLWRR